MAFEKLHVFITGKSELISPSGNIIVNQFPKFEPISSVGILTLIKSQCQERQLYLDKSLNLTFYQMN